MRNCHHGDKWLPGVVQQKTGPVSYRVKLNNGKTRRCHQDQVRKRSVEIPQDSHYEPDISDIVIPSSSPEITSTNTELVLLLRLQLLRSRVQSLHHLILFQLTQTNVIVNPTPEKSYPKCNRVPVVRFEPTWT